MASGAVEPIRTNNVADIFEALLGSEGTSGHAFLNREGDQGLANGRTLTDVIHHVCALHGRHPGVVDLAGERVFDNAIVRAWVEATRDAFARERSYVTRVMVAAGPLPSTPGQAECETAILGQRHAIEMLAKSDRNGCALGAAMALALDWSAWRSVINRAATRFGIEAPELLVPPAAETLSVARVAAKDSPALERAMVFGAQQLLVQHRGLWDLLEARQIAREY